VALICELIAFAGCAEGLAGGRSGPDFAAIFPPRFPECVGPDCDSGEEMALSKTSQVFWSNIDN
jgi:hypothetical protein